MEVFRAKKRMRMPYHRQGYIYFVSRCYKDLPKVRRERIERHCRNVGGEYWDALFEFVTKDSGAVAICCRYHISDSTLKRMVKRYYMEFPMGI